MNNTAKRAYVLLAVIAAFLAGIALLMFFFIKDGASWATNKANRHIYTNGSISSAGAVYDCNNEVLAKSVDGKRRYNDSREVRMSTLHTVGDLNGFIATGVQYTYRNTLTGYDFIDGISSMVQYGQGNDIYLTIDSSVCRTAYSALNGRNGAVCVYNYQTGKIVCMVSSPTYDPKNKPSDIDTNSKYAGVYLNRVLSGVYTPGSIFKIVTAVCAVENIPDIYSRSFNCTGQYSTGDGVVKCNGTHGKVNFEQALNHSCNSAFAQIAIELGSEKLTATAKELGFNIKLDTNGIATPAKSVLSLDNTTKTDLGWAGIGQYTTLVNPYHMASIMGCIANSGTTVEPYVVDFVKTLLTWKNAFRLIGALFVIFLMWLAFKLIKHFVKKVSAGKIQQQYVLVITKTISYVFYALVVMYVLSLFGVKLGAIWGAAGIAGVAVGFAAQTSVSNLISGLFVLGEKAMKVGDFIEVGGVSGTVDSVGLLSVKVHTLNNQMVRIPNSSIINSNFQNNSFFEVRRFSFELSVDYATDMNVALQALSSVPELCPSVLKEPAPAVWYNGFGESGINIVLAVWFNSSDLVKMKNEVYIAIKKVFDEKGINIPFNRLDVSMVEA